MFNIAFIRVHCGHIHCSFAVPGSSIALYFGSDSEKQIIRHLFTHNIICVICVICGQIYPLWPGEGPGEFKDAAGSLPDC